MGHQRVAARFLIEQHHAGHIVLGRAAVQGAIIKNVLNAQLQGADAVIFDEVNQEYSVAFVARNTHFESIKKSQKSLKAIAKVEGQLHLLGDSALIKKFKREGLRTAISMHSTA